MSRHSRTPTLHRLVHDQAFLCENGSILPSLEITYTTFGQLSEDEDNVVWVLHPLTCTSDPTAWWPELVGHGCAINPEVHFIVCVNALGSCYGTTGPASIDPRSGRPYAMNFPLVTIKDIIAVHEIVRTHLGIDRIRIGVGGSFGGQQLLQWMVTRPQLMELACVIGADLRQSPWAVAFNESQRMALEADATFGDVNGGQAGLAAARSMAVLSYRSALAYQRKQSEDSDQVFDRLRAASYQRYIGQKFTQRFNAWSYWYLTKAMDSHNILRGLENGPVDLLRVTTRVLFAALRDDLLFPVQDIYRASLEIPGARCVTIETDYGHDGILTHAKEIGAEIASFAAEDRGRRSTQGANSRSRSKQHSIGPHLSTTLVTPTD